MACAYLEKRHNKLVSGRRCSRGGGAAMLKVERNTNTWSDQRAAVGTRSSMLETTSI
jgi:hypothetical protein